MNIHKLYTVMYVQTDLQEYYVLGIFGKGKLCEMWS